MSNKTESGQAPKPFADATGSATKKRTRRWNSSYRKPSRRGWYECKARDGRWGGMTKWRAWGRGMWWIPLGKGDGSDGWLSSPMGIYQWRGPAHDLMGPPPNVKLTDSRP